MDENFEAWRPDLSGKELECDLRFLISLLRRRLSVKLRRGLRGFVGGKEMSALPDSGADQNIITVALAKTMGLKIGGSPAYFRLGNSKPLLSLGLTRIDWSFAQEPSKTVQIRCHVVPECTYDLILGRRFLKATRTLSKYRDRLTNCLSTTDAMGINALGNSPERLLGIIGETHLTLAIPDTGADRNVMDMQYAQAHGFPILKKPENLNYLRFADNSVQETVGQVKTTWTLGNGDVEPVTFEVLENCMSDVILGDEILWKHDVFRRHASYLIHLHRDEESATMRLAPFGFLKVWQGSMKKRSTRSKSSQASTSCSIATSMRDDTEESRRRELWNLKNGFDGQMARIEEREAEARRRREYKDMRHCNGSNQQINTGRATGRGRVSADARGPNGSEGRLVRLPSIPTATVDLRFEEPDDGS